MPQATQINIWNGVIEEYEDNHCVVRNATYDKKAFEIVLPDVIITEDTLKVLNEFQATWAEKGIEVWYRVTK